MLDSYNNQLTSVTLPAGLTSLGYLSLNDNQLTNLTLPAELTNLTQLGATNSVQKFYRAWHDQSRDRKSMKSFRRR